MYVDRYKKNLFDEANVEANVKEFFWKEFKINNAAFQAIIYNLGPILRTIGSQWFNNFFTDKLKPRHKSQTTFSCSITVIYVACPCLFVTETKDRRFFKEKATNQAKNP